MSIPLACLLDNITVINSIYIVEKMRLALTLICLRGPLISQCGSQIVLRDHYSLVHPHLNADVIGLHFIYIGYSYIG